MSDIIDRLAAEQRGAMMVNGVIDYEGLKLAVDSGMIDIAAIQKQVEMADAKKYLKEHRFKIYQGKDGKWNTYVPDETEKYGRKLVRKNTKEEVEKEVIRFYRLKEREPTVKDVFDQWVQLKLEYGDR